MLAEQVDRKVRLGELIYEKNLVGRDDLIQATEDLTHYKFCNVEQLRPDIPALRLVPLALAQKHCCVPIRLNGRSIEVAFAEPQDLAALHELSFATGLQIAPYMGFRAEIQNTMDRFYRADADDLDKPATAAIEDASAIEFISASSRHAHQDAMREFQANQRGQKTEAVSLLSSIMAGAFERKASDIHFEQQSEALVVRLRVDGVLRELHRVTDEVRAQLISRIKILSDLDISERRVPQDGRFVSRHGGESFDIRVSTLPTHFGEKVVMRILDPNAANVPFQALGFSPHDSAALTRLLRLPQGMILVTGPTGSGKTTTLYSALNLVRSSAINIITIEDPIEYILDGANQVQVDTKVGRTFANCLRSVLRQDPNVVMVGEIRDAETAEIALTGAQTGHLVFSTLHTNDSFSAVSRLIDLKIPPFLVASSLNAILAQRLVRKLCPCRIESSDVTGLRSELLAMGYDETPVASYLPKGCADCDNTGYKGRIGVYELLLLDDHIRQAIRNDARDEVLRDYATSSGMRLMIDDAISKVLQGVTTVNEVLRVVPHTKRLVPFCTHCRSTLNPSFRFCPVCGTECPSHAMVLDDRIDEPQALGRTM